MVNTCAVGLEFKSRPAKSYFTTASISSLRKQPCYFDAMSRRRTPLTQNTLRRNTMIPVFVSMLDFDLFFVTFATSRISKLIIHWLLTP